MRGRKQRRRLWITGGLLVLGAILAGWLNSPFHPEISIGGFQRDLTVKLGLDLQGGSHLVYRANVDEIPSGERDDAIAGVRDVIERRVNAFGVSEPVVQTNKVDDEYRIIVELAGVHDPQTAISLIGQTPQLDFRREVITDDTPAQPNVDDPSAFTGPVFERTDLTGRHLDRATVDFDQVLGSPQVVLEFDGEGSDLFAEITSENIGRRIAIYLDGIPISAPVVQSEITNGRAVISGGFTIEEANQLARNLRAGALPVPVDLIGQQRIGPSLGQRSVQESVAAGVLGLVAVMVYMILFYRLSGVVASLALGFYALLFLLIVKLIPITLTLAGVAGFILSIGMAVDANVLIFERFKENIRNKKSFGYALEDGFKDAWNSIRASNVSSLLTAIILYYFGTSLIRGFALTFAIGIGLSMFTAITVTRTLLGLLTLSKKMQGAWLLGAGVKKETSS